jgi:accessory colonization factor AcfC
MTAFLETYKTFSSEQVEPINIRPTIIAVKKGNPKNIKRFEDLLKPGVKIVVTEGEGVSNTSGTGTWEDVAGRLGRLEDIRSFRRNIVAFGKGSGASLKAFKDLDAGA